MGGGGLTEAPHRHGPDRLAWECQQPEESHDHGACSLRQRVSRQTMREGPSTGVSDGWVGSPGKTMVHEPAL